MSWSRSFESLDDFAHDRGVPDGPIQGPGGNQYIVARQAAEGILASGTVGASGRDFRITLAGHANPNHEPVKGWANDTITVTVTQK